MTISLVYTSRRASMIQEVVTTWLERAAEPGRIQVVVSIDADYAEGLTEAEAAITTARVTTGHGSCLVVKNHGANTCVAGWNAGAAHATGQVLIAVADDFSPPQNWDESLQQCAARGWWLDDHVVWTSDGFVADAPNPVFTLGIITRKRYERFGLFFYVGYQSLFCDTELTAVAILEGVVIDARGILFEHLHPDCNKRPRDEVDTRHASSLRWKHGESLFNMRRDTGFPLDAGPVAEALDPTYADLKFAVYVQAIRDDLCLVDVVERIIDTAGGRISAVYLCTPDEYWDGRKQSPADLAEVVEASNQLFVHARDRFPVILLTQPVADFRVLGRSRIQVETFVRNAAVNHIRGQGHQHLIVVDGDELWQPGLVDHLADYVREYRPGSVFTGMVPVIGLPGYPVVGALDKATIYIGPGAWFVECRGASGHRHELPGHDVIHFTATRRTMAEIIAKHRDSGHADDKSYDFETWISAVLPHIRPGFRYRWSESNVGLHMYLPYQVWPNCREWTPAEWATLPNSVKPYLAVPVT